MWGLIASLFVGMVLLLALNLSPAPLWAKLLRIPRPYLYAGILFFAAVGAYAVGGEVIDLVIPLIIDLVIPLIIGLTGFGMRRYGLPSSASSSARTPSSSCVAPCRSATAASRAW